MRNKCAERHVIYQCVCHLQNPLVRVLIMIVAEVEGLVCCKMLFFKHVKGLGILSKARITFFHTQLHLRTVLTRR